MDRPAHPPLTRTDAWLLAALTEGSYDGRPVTLADFLHDADWLNRLIPAFDEVSFGLQRLLAAGFLTVGDDVASGLVLRATTEARRLRRSVKARTLGDVLAGVAAAVGAAPYPETEPDEDRTLGRLAGLDRDDYDRALRDYETWFDRMSGLAIDAARRIVEGDTR